MLNNINTQNINRINNFGAQNSSWEIGRRHVVVGAPDKLYKYSLEKELAKRDIFDKNVMAEMRANKKKENRKKKLCNLLAGVSTIVIGYLLCKKS